METAVISPLAASAEKTNGDKLSRFSIDGGTTVLRKAFDDFYPPTNFASVLNGNYSILNNHLRKRVVNKDQWDKLFSPDGVESDFNKFNTTLFFLLLINICSLSDPLSGCHAKAPPHDVCFEANRNVLFSDMTSTSVDGQPFSLLWQEVSSTLHALGLEHAEIDRLRTEHGGQQDYIDALIEWDNRENKIKTQLKDIHQMQLELRKALQDSNSKVEELLSNAQGKTQDVADEAVKMEPKGHKEMTAAHQKSMSCLEGLSEQEMTAAHQKSMSCLERLSEQEMTAAHQKSMSCLEGLSEQEMTAAHQKRMLCLEGISHKEMTAAHQKSMSCLEGLREQEMTAARQKSMSCLEGLREQEMTAAHQKRMLCLEGTSHKEMTAAHQKSMSLLEGLSEQEMTAAHQKSMSCLEGLREQEMTAAHQKNMSLLEGLVIKSQSKTQQEIHEIRESVQQVKHEVKTLKKRTNEQTDETSPVEFFGVPLNDQELLDADPWYVLGACKRFISSDTYDELLTHLTSGYRTPKQVLRSLLEVLAGLDSKDQDECLEAIIHALREASEEGFSHVIERLQKGRQMVSLPLTEKREVIPKVSERVGSSWKSLARHLKLEDEVINSLAGEERGDRQRCYIILRRWCKYNRRNATVRKLMIALTKMGKAEVNNDIMRCLDLVKPYVVDTSVTNAFQPKMLRSKL